MSKRIVFCADGTWDAPVNMTNVQKMHLAIKLIPDEQYPLYDDGLGAGGLLIQKLTGGAFGTGIFNKIKDGYTKLALSYESQSQVFLFGFSRGAYTARCLAGMLKVAGLPTKPFNQKTVDTVFDAYRHPEKRAALPAALAKYGMEPVDIQMIGVWDTVGSLGIPSIFGGNEPLLYGFLDTTLNPTIKNAFHAMAIDERRMEFPATLWDTAPAPGQTVEQVWFAGVHGCVGGGAGTGLSDITLAWMMGKARDQGVIFEDDVWAQYANVDPKHSLDDYKDSWNVGWGFPRPRTIGAAASIANSVRIRWDHLPGYRPANLALGAAGSEYSFVDVVAEPDIAGPAGVPAGV